jgi:hypothetical protein
MPTLPRLMPTASTDEPAEVGQASALKIQHPNRRVGALPVLLNQRVPRAAVWAVQFVTGSQILNCVHTFDLQRLR